MLAIDTPLVASADVDALVDAGAGSTLSLIHI